MTNNTVKAVRMLRPKKRSEYRRYTRSKGGTVLYFSLLFLAGMFTVLPMIYCICTSFKPLDELLIFPPRFLVHRPTLENYIALPSLLNTLRVPMERYFFNSLFISISGVILHVMAASAAAFVFSKSQIKGRRILFMIVQFALLYNSYTLSVPQYLIFSKIGIVDTYLVYLFPAIPSAMGCFLMKQFIDVSVPNALMEAARIDGAGMGRIYWQIVMPIAKPSWMTLMLFSFRDLWSTVPSGTIFSEELKLIPQVMTNITNGGIARSGSAMAATVLMMLPPIIVYFIAQSNVIETMSSSGIK